MKRPETATHPETIVPGWSRYVRIDELQQGDFVGVWDDYGEVVRIKGPHGPLGTPPTTDWYTLHVLFDGDHARTVVGPKRGDAQIVSWS